MKPQKVLILISFISVALASLLTILLYAKICQLHREGYLFYSGIAMIVFSLAIIAVTAAAGIKSFISKEEPEKKSIIVLLIVSIIAAVGELVGGIIEVTMITYYDSLATGIVMMILVAPVIVLASVSIYRIKNDKGYGLAIGVSAIYVVYAFVNLILGLTGDAMDIVGERGYLLFVGARLMDVIAYGVFLATFITAFTEYRKTIEPIKEKEKEELPESTPKQSDAADQLEKLKDLLDKGIITKEEYDEKRKKYVDLL